MLLLMMLACPKDGPSSCTPECRTEFGSCNATPGAAVGSDCSCLYDRPDLIDGTTGDGRAEGTVACVQDPWPTPINRDDLNCPAGYRFDVDPAHPGTKRCIGPSCALRDPNSVEVGDYNASTMLDKYGCVPARCYTQSPAHPTASALKGLCEGGFNPGLNPYAGFVQSCQEACGAGTTATCIEATGCRTLSVGKLNSGGIGYDGYQDDPGSDALCLCIPRQGGG